MTAFDMALVHIRDEVARECRPGLVIARQAIPVDGHFPALRVRVIRPSGIGPVGIDDDEGSYRHTSDRQYVANPAGEQLRGRYLDHWHRIGSCGYEADEPAGAGYSVEAGRG